MLYELLGAAAICSAMSGALLCAATHTALIIHVANWMTGKRCAFSSFDDVIAYLDVHKPVLADLLKCPLCLGTWICLFVATWLGATGVIVSMWDVPAVAFTALPLSVVISHFLGKVIP